MTSEKRLKACGNCWEYVLPGGTTYGSCSCEMCPHCRHAIDAYAFEEDVEGEGEYEIECPSCEKTIEYSASYYIDVSIHGGSR